MDSTLKHNTRALYVEIVEFFVSAMSHSRHRCNIEVGHPDCYLMSEWQVKKLSNNDLHTIGKAIVALIEHTTPLGISNREWCGKYELYTDDTFLHHSCCCNVCEHFRSFAPRIDALINIQPTCEPRTLSIINPTTVNLTRRSLYVEIVEFFVSPPSNTRHSCNIQVGHPDCYPMSQREVKPLSDCDLISIGKAIIGIIKHTTPLWISNNDMFERFELYCDDKFLKSSCVCHVCEHFRTFLTRIEDDEGENITS